MLGGAVPLKISMCWTKLKNICHWCKSVTRNGPRWHTFFSVFFKLNSYSNASVFYRFVACAFPFFEGKSVLPIDRYQIASLVGKKFNFKSVSRSWHRILLVNWKRSAWAFYRYSGVGVWVKTLQLIAKRLKKKTLAFQYEFSFRLKFL